MIARLKFILDRSLTVSNILEKSIAAYGADFEILRFSGSLAHLGVDGQSLTLGELKRVCDRLSSALLNLGLQRFDRVAVYKAPSVDYLIYSLAIMRAGAITVPVNGGLPIDDIRQYLDYTGARFVFTDGTHIGKLDLAALAAGRQRALLSRRPEDLPLPIGAHVLSDVVPEHAVDFTPVAIHDHDDAMIVHTSGTTGFPKGVLHGSHSLIRGTKGQLMIQPIGRNNRILLASPANHHITQAAIITCMAAGIPAYVPAEETAVDLLHVIESERCSLVLAFPDLYQGMCQAPMSDFRLDHVKSWMAGGDSSHEVHIRQLTSHGAFVSVFGKPLIRSMYVEFLGTSEVGFAALLKMSFSFTKRYARYVGKRTIVSPKVKLVDKDGKPVPTGQPGRLMVKGPTLFKGYWNAHDRLHGVTIDGWWWTGDICRRDRWGGYYHLDREVDSIRSDEGVVYSLPIEEEILKHPLVADVAVLELNGEVGAVIECQAGKALRVAQVQDWLRSHLPEHSSMRIIVLPADERLPRGLTGKVLKRRLRERYHQAPNPVTKLPESSDQRLEIA